MKEEEQKKIKKKRIWKIAFNELLPLTGLVIGTTFIHKGS